jgi:hypothetical protein
MQKSSATKFHHHLHRPSAVTRIDVVTFTAHCHRIAGRDNDGRCRSTPRDKERVPVAAA